MSYFGYWPSPAEIVQLSRLRNHEGWAVFLRVMDECKVQIGLQAIDEMDGPNAKPSGWYRGYKDAIVETVARIDTMIESLTAERQAESDAVRLGPARGQNSSGDTAS